ncbi:MAG TPA: hypothetical protein VMT55_02980, partial [Candidatus Sulfotelmatobacter sp.]|nr:hypothetical protein [Candidatus Sulfotelmatobacter sp.]
MGLTEILFTGSRANRATGPGCGGAPADSDSVIITGTAFQDAWENAGFDKCAPSSTVFKLDTKNIEPLARNLAVKVLTSDAFKKIFAALTPKQKEAAIIGVARQMTGLNGKHLDDFRARSASVKCGASDFYGNYFQDTVKLPLPKLAVVNVLNEAKKVPEVVCQPVDEKSYYALVPGYLPPKAIVNKPVDLGALSVVYSGPKAVEPGDCRLESFNNASMISQYNLTIIPLKEGTLPKEPAAAAAQTTPAAPAAAKSPSNVSLEETDEEEQAKPATAAKPAAAAPAPAKPEQPAVAPAPTLPFKAVEIQLGNVKFTQVGP